MRLVATFKNPQEAEKIADFLTLSNIANQLDVETNNDWGSVEYSDVTARLWIIDEDQVDLAIKKIDEYKNNPEKALKELPVVHKASWLEDLNDEPLTKKKTKTIKLKDINEKGFGKITSAILALCIMFLMISNLTRPSQKDIPDNVPLTSVFTSPINKMLMFDYPSNFSIMDKIIKAYGIDSFKDPNSMSTSEQILVAKYLNTPYWVGIYPQIVAYVTQGSSFNFSAPMFEKIREGEVWRAVTPILLHYDIFHLFFNMMWLIVVGKMMEEKLGTFRYILFILTVAIFSNTMQYLMSGSNFLGFSGVLCGMIAFIWMRQKRAAWEGYQLQSSTINFIALFIVAMFGIQLISFSLEVYTQTTLPIGIANTAHLTGALMGAILGYLDFFAYKT